MELSDWITIIATIFSIFISGALAWIIYQLQHSMDIRQLTSDIRQLFGKIDNISKNIKLEKHVEDMENLATIREKVAKIDIQLNSVVSGY